MLRQPEMLVIDSEPVLHLCFHPWSVQRYCGSCWVKRYDEGRWTVCGVGCDQCCVVVGVDLIGEPPLTDVNDKCQGALRHYPIDSDTDKKA